MNKIKWWTTKYDNRRTLIHGALGNSAMNLMVFDEQWQCSERGGDFLKLMITRITESLSLSEESGSGR